MELSQEFGARNEDAEAPTATNETGRDRDVVRLTAKATAAAIAVGAIGFGIWEVRSIVILLLLSLTFAAAIRPGVEWLNRHRVQHWRRSSPSSSPLEL
jgi:predicted PurR-regulated permease PerM